MGGRCSNGKRPKAGMLFADTLDTLERLIVENIELRRTAAELALQTATLRESLDEAKLARLRSVRRLITPSNWN